MSANSKIEWTDHTFNPWEGCQKVGPGCDHCYAEARNARFAGGTAINWGPGAPRRRTSAANWKKPLQWNREKFFQCQCGWRGSEKELDVQKGGMCDGVAACPDCDRMDYSPARARVFCASLADVFDNAVDPQWRRDLFDLIRATPNLDWLLLTKRIGNVKNMIDRTLLRNLPNLWMGATVVNQFELDRDAGELVKVPAAKHFLSMEPLLEPVNLRFPTRTWAPGRCNHCCNGDRCDDVSHYDRVHCPFCRGTGQQKFIDWVIVGGESGPKARPMHPAWARSLRDQCAAAGVPFMFKQWGEWLPGQNDVHPHTNDRKVAHHQDGSWGATDTKPNSRNYVAWDASGRIHRGSLIDAPANFSMHAWAERVGKKNAGRLLDGVQHDGYPEVSA